MSSSHNKDPLSTRVRVSTPARLHLGFLDLNGDAGRKFGSIGMALNSHQTIVDAHFTDVEVAHEAPQSIQQKLNRLVTAFFEAFSDQILLPRHHVKLVINTLIPEHAGLGSGTQLALAVGTALCRLHNLDASTHDIAAALDRGARSGIGIASFDHGGFLIDGGLGPDSVIPPLVAQYTYPDEWRVVLIMQSQHQGVHGTAESKAFKTLPPFPISQSHAICHLTLMKLLPALVEQDINAFGQSITEIQNLIGDNFSAAQGGRYSSEAVAALLYYATQLGHQGIAQSSWGPTGCIFVEDEGTARVLIEQLNNYVKEHFPAGTNYTLLMTSANSTGAHIELSVDE